MFDPLGIVDLTPGVVAAVAFGVANLGHPKFVASPNAYSVPSFSSFVQLVDDVFVGSSTDALSMVIPAYSTILDQVLLSLHRLGNCLGQTISLRIRDRSSDKDINRGELLFMIVGLVQPVTHLYHSPIHSNPAKQPL